eukprot:14584661-Heterocapsa_arctica.AAC.1
MRYNELNEFELDGTPTAGPALLEWQRWCEEQAAHKGQPLRGNPDGQGKGNGPDPATAGGGGSAQFRGPIAKSHPSGAPWAGGSRT